MLQAESYIGSTPWKTRNKSQTSHNPRLKRKDNCLKRKEDLHLQPLQIRVTHSFLLPISQIRKARSWEALWLCFSWPRPLCADRLRNPRKSAGWMRKAATCWVVLPRIKWQSCRILLSLVVSRICLGVFQVQIIQMAHEAHQHHILSLSESVTGEDNWFSMGSEPASGIPQTGLCDITEWLSGS